MTLNLFAPFDSMYRFIFLPSSIPFHECNELPYSHCFQVLLLFKKNCILLLSNFTIMISFFSHLLNILVDINTNNISRENEF